MILTKDKIHGIDLEALVKEKLDANLLSELLLIVPTNRKLRNFKKELITGSRNQTAGVINIETIGTLTTNILTEAESFIQLTDAAASVLMKQSIRESKLEYFSGYREGIPAGTLDRIRRVISEYKKSGIKPDDLLRESDQLEGSEKSKAKDIAEIFSRFQKKCSELRAKETGDIYDAVNCMSGGLYLEIFNKLYPSVNTILIDGFDEFTGPEIGLIDRISSTGRKLFLNFDYYNNNPLIFSHLDKCYNSLLSRGFTPVRDQSTERLPEFRSIIRKELFHPPSVKYEQFDQLFLIEALDRRKEIEYIAREVKYLIKDKGVNPHRICVAFNLIDKYSPVVRDSFSNSGIPFNLTDRLSLANSSPVTTIINYLEIIENDFFYKNLFRALSNEQLRIKGIDLAGLLKVSARLRIVAGYSNWTASLRDAIDSCRYIEDDITKEKELSLYTKALEDIEAINEFLNPFTKKMKLLEFIPNLKRLINDLGLPVKLLEIKGREEENIKAVTVFIDTLNEVITLLGMEHNPEEKFSLEFYLDQIRTAVTSARFNIKEKSNYGVLVTTFNEIRGLSFDYLFLAGLTDGDFPTRYNPEIFFSGTYIRNELVHQTEERYSFYQVLCSWEQGLYLSYPLQDNEKELTVSNFLKDFTDLFSVQVREGELFDKRIYSRDNLLKLIGTQEFSALSAGIEHSIDLGELTNAVKIDNARLTDPFGESIYTGTLTSTDGNFSLSDSAIKSLNKLEDREFSITQLEKYAACPYQYFLERILYLNVIEEPTEEFEAFEIGTLVHSILFDFYKEVTLKNIRIAGCSDKQFSALSEMLFSIAQNKLDQENFTPVLSFYDKETILGINGDPKNSILYKFLETERSADPDFIPLYFETSFKENISINGGSVRVRGMIDRIEVNEDGSQFNTVDYKLGGKKPGNDDLWTGLSLQLPLYMFAASNLLKVSFGQDFLPADALIYSLKFKAERFGRLSVNLKGKKTFSELNDKEREELLLQNQQLIKICIESIANYAASIKDGRFHLSKLKDRENRVCRFCNFHSVCRIQEAQH